MRKGGKRLQENRSEPPREKGGKWLQIQQRETHGKPRGVMAAAILLAVSVAVVAGVTFGWYDLLRETQAGAVVLNSEGQNINVDGFTIIASSEANSDILNSNTIILKSCDSVFGRNSKTPVYILIPVSGEAVQQGHTLQFKFDCGNDTLVDGDKVQPCLTNVAQLRYVVVSNPSGLLSYEAARDQFYAKDGSVRTGVSTSKCFASFTVNKNTHVLQPNWSKNKFVELSVNGYSASGEIYVLFELDYNFELVTGFVDNYASGIADRLDQTQNLQFNKETLTITVSAS